jgi:hypothetical protein
MSTGPHYLLCDRGSDATNAQAEAAIASVLPELDDAIDLEELVGGEV